MSGSGTRSEGVTGVKERNTWPVYPAPQAPDNAQPKQEVLLVDRYGKPLMVREPRAVGFRKP